LSDHIGGQMNIHSLMLKVILYKLLKHIDGKTSLSPGRRWKLSKLSKFLKELRFPF